jgi:hypothetical protein
MLNIDNLGASRMNTDVTATNDVPEVYVIGSPKCGTTTVTGWLEQHPEVYFSPVKEPHYFNSDMLSKRGRSKDEYLDLFSEARPDQIRAEGSVWYLYSEAAVPNILAENPEAKFIVCVRNPVDMFISLHAQLLFNGSENETCPQRAWTLQDSRLQGNSIPPHNDDPSILQYRDTCKAGKLIERLLSMAPENQVKVVFLEDMKENPERMWFEICDFIGLERIPPVSYAANNVAATRKWPLLAKAVKFATVYRKKMGIPVPSKRLRKFLRQRLTDLDHANRKVGSREPLDASFRGELVSFFSDDVGLLENVTSRNLSHWK